MKVARPEPIAASAIATSGAASSRNDTAANRLAKPDATMAGSTSFRQTARMPLTRMLAQTRRSRNSSTLEPLFQETRDRQHRQEAEQAIDQRHVDIDEAAGYMRVEGDQRNRDDSQ